MSFMIFHLRMKSKSERVTKLYLFTSLNSDPEYSLMFNKHRAAYSKMSCNTIYDILYFLLLWDDIQHDRYIQIPYMSDCATLGMLHRPLTDIKLYMEQCIAFKQISRSWEIESTASSTIDTIKPLCVCLSVRIMFVEDIHAHVHYGCSPMSIWEGK